MYGLRYVIGRQLYFMVQQQVFSSCRRTDFILPAQIIVWPEHLTLLTYYTRTERESLLLFSPTGAGYVQQCVTMVPTRS